VGGGDRFVAPRNAVTDAEERVDGPGRVSQGKGCGACVCGEFRSSRREYKQGRVCSTLLRGARTTAAGREGMEDGPEKQAKEEGLDSPTEAKTRRKMRRRQATRKRPKQFRARDRYGTLSCVLWRLRTEILGEMDRLCRDDADAPAQTDEYQGRCS
jgi:hypothetical protein